MKGRGAQNNPHNRFLSNRYEDAGEQRMSWDIDETEGPGRTTFTEVYPRTILSENDSPDLHFRYGINPYQGCEHGCVYCYARNSHEYWGYGAGTDFETRILYKPRAAELLEKTFRSATYEPGPIMFSGNTDCYQPAERNFGITRELLKVLLRHRHPVGIITKNALLLRDMDILEQLHERGLLSVTLSITTLREEVRRAMEPRTSSVQQRLQTLSELTSRGIPVNVNMAPIIMGINSDEVFDLVREVGERGAYRVTHIMVRLNGQIAGIFETWLRSYFPDRADKVLNQIRDTHGGKLNESQWGARMKGRGQYASQIEAMFRIASGKFIQAEEPPPLRFDLFSRNPDQYGLFDE